MRVIAADDQPDVLEALRLLLKREGMSMTTMLFPSVPGLPTPESP